MRPYRDSHAAAGYGERYSRTYETGYYAAQWREVEAPLLRRILAPLGGAKKTCLDFACGTGRIARRAGDHFSRVVAVDVSAEMLAHATAAENVDYRHIDIAQRPLDEVFDVVTAFRFFLKADPALRSEALDAIRAHLKPGGLLVANIHMQATSPLGLIYWLQRGLTGRAHETMSVREFAAILASHGFSIERVEHYGFAPRPGHFLPGLMERLIAPLERLARRLRLPGGLAQCFMVVARKA